MIRSTEFLTWKDASHWMEAMKGHRWTERVKEENMAFNREVEDAASREEISTATRLFKKYQKDHDLECSFPIEHGITKLRIIIQSGNSYILSWPQHMKKEVLIGDIDTTRNGLAVYTHDISHGGELYEVICCKLGKQLWRFNGRGVHGVASDVAILGSRVYLLEAHGPLQYKWLISLDLETGKDKRIHYTEKRESIALELLRGENGCLFLHCEDAGTQNLFWVTEQRVRQLSAKATSFFPVGYGRDAQEPCYFARTSVESPWIPYGAALKELKLSKASLTSTIELCVLNCGLLMYRRQGERFLISCSRRREPKEVAKVLGEMHIHNWPIWYGQAGASRPVEFSLIIPGKTPVKAHYSIKDGLILDKPKEVYGGAILAHTATSKDGQKVRFLLTWKRGAKPKALLMIGYGAYGMTTPFETTRWRPYIEAGFAVGFALVRGGGDDTELWAKMGRLQGKLQGIEDFEACIRSAQDILDVPAERTCLFGRSAGGFLVGGAVVRNPDGELFGAVYTEAPYVDVLQTSANEDLPLTKFEYNEFGDPIHRIADFEFLLRLSPVNGLGPKGAPGVLVLCRVGLNDRQVFAYESVKWMDALRGDMNGGKPKLLSLTSGHGHVVRGDDVYEERAKDFLLLCKKLLGYYR